MDTAEKHAGKDDRITPENFGVEIEAGFFFVNRSTGTCDRRTMLHRVLNSSTQTLNLPIRLKK